MSYYQIMQRYRNAFKPTSPTDIRNYVETLWSDRNISSDHPSLNPFIERNHSQIVHECASDIENFDKNVLQIANDYQSKYNPFNLKLRSVGGNVEQNYTTHFVVSYNQNIHHKYKTRKLNNNKSKDNCQFLCKCIFEKWTDCNILKIISDCKFRLQCQFLNDDTTKGYAVVKITNAFHIFTSDSDEEKKQFVKHIRSCQWIKTTEFSLFLYLIQMDHAKKFITNIMSMNNISEREEMKASQMNECNNSINKAVKRERNDNMNNMQTNDTETPLLKRRKLSNYIPVITDDDYHIIETPASIMSVSQHEGHEDIEINDIKCKESMAQSVMQIEQEHIPFFNWEADIERDYNNVQNDNIQLDLTAIQSVILYKSAQQCQSCLKLNGQQYEMHKQNIIQCIQQTGRTLFEWHEPNESQYDAICKATLNPFSLIHGPPGTGKTSTSAQLINAIIKNNLLKTNKKIFVCAYTHNAINELLKKISVLLPDDSIVRLGDKDRCPKQYKKYCLEQRMEGYKPRNQNETEDAWQNIFHCALVVIGTVYSARSRELNWLMESQNNGVFDWCLIDECTQIMDAVLTIACNVLDETCNSHLILIGDHKQLPPVIKSEIIKTSGYKTVFETLVEEIDNKYSIGYYQMLEMQYRMAQCLMEFSNNEWYDNKIESFQKQVDWNDNGLSCINDMIINKIKMLSNVKVYCNNDRPIYVIHIPNGEAKRDMNLKKSWKNDGEATFICQNVLEELIKHNSSISIGIVSLYKAQAKCIDLLMRQIGMKGNGCDIMSHTADAFQGKEKDLIIISLVKDVMEGNNMFLNDSKRINVALTRCKKAVIVVTSFDISKAHIGCSDGNNNVWKRFFKQFDYGINRYHYQPQIESKAFKNNNTNINNSNRLRVNYNANINNSNQLGVNFNSNRNNNVQVNNVEPLIRNDNEQEVWDFLEEINLTEHYNLFIEKGIDRMSFVQEITIDHLTKIGVSKWYHQVKITKAAKKSMGVIF